MLNKIIGGVSGVCNNFWTKNSICYGHLQRRGAGENNKSERKEGFIAAEEKLFNSYS